MKKNEALAVLNSKIVSGDVDIEGMYTVCEVESQIRILSRADKGFEDTVYELGVSTLAKAYFKEKEKQS